MIASRIAMIAIEFYARGDYDSVDIFPAVIQSQGSIQNYPEGSPYQSPIKSLTRWV